MLLHYRSLAGTLILAGALLLGDGSKPAASVPAAGQPEQEMFGLTRVLQVELRLTPEAWESMQPTGPPQFGPGAASGRETASAATFNVPAGGKPSAQKKGKRAAHRTAMGMEYPIVHASLKLDQREYTDVALRYKGNFTYMASSRGLNRPFRVDLDRFVKGRTIGGVSRFSLNNNISDSSRMREALAYEVFRQAKAPAPRTAFARVLLTVPGRFERQHLGLYTLVEAVEERFLKAQFGTDAGLLLKPQFQGLPYLGEEWAAYSARFGDGVKGIPPAASTARYITLARLVDQGDDAAFRQGIAGLIDVDEFLRFLAVNALLVNLDSFLAMGQNYYLYHDPGKNRFSWIPWDLDLAFGAWPMGGSPEQQAELSLLHPYRGENRLIERILNVPEHRATYLALIRELLRGPFSVQRLNALVDAARLPIRAALADEGAGALQAFDRATGTGTAPFGSFPLGMPSLPLRSFFRQRVQSANSQLAGTRTGYVIPTSGPGPGMVEGPGQALSRPLFRAADRDQDSRLTPAELGGMLARWGAAWDTDRSKFLDRNELVRGLNQLFGFQPDGPHPGDQAGQHPLGGPGGFLGPQLFKSIDTNFDGRATAAELAAAARTWLRQWDRDRNGLLAQHELGVGLSAPEFGGR